MTQRVPDSIIATFARQEHDWMQRVLKGSLDPVRVARAVQVLIDQGGDNLFSIDYNMSLEQMIAAGHYNSKNSDITPKRFPIVGSGVVEVGGHKFFHFDRTISSGEAEHLIIADGWQLGKIEHLLAHVVAYPEEQCKFPIVALGSPAVLNGDRVVPYVWGDDAYRGLSLGWWLDYWHRDCRFLAVRN
jgi:hypothetical protein